MAKSPPPGGGTGQTIAQAFAALGEWAWFNSPVTNYFDGVLEKGQDYSTKWGTPVGVPVGGVVKRIVHNTSTINDVVEIMDSSGAVWLYQHINTVVSVGQTLLCGSIVGTENGCTNNDSGGVCAIDQYSTGPHIEVRWCPPGQWNPGTISWLEPWVNPRTIFANIGNQQAGTVSSGGGGYPGGGLGGWNGQITFGGTSVFQGFVNGVQATTKPLAPNANVVQTLAAMDAYLVLINPFVFQNGEPTFTIGIPGVSVGPIGVGGGGATFPDPIAWAQDVAVNMALDANAFLIRSILFFAGLAIMIKVISAVIDFDAIGTSIKNTINPTGMSPQDVVGAAGAFL